MIRQTWIALRMMLLMTILTGLAYPFVVERIAASKWPEKASGSLLNREGRVIGSSLIGQSFSRPEYFHPRPSAVKYDASLSGGSNLGPTSQVLVDRVRADADRFRAENPEFTAAFPADLLTTSGSGLDPHISPASAYAQTMRIARTRGVSPGEIERLISTHIEPRQLGILGEPRVNVLLLNFALDREFPVQKP